MLGRLERRRIKSLNGSNILILLLRTITELSLGLLAMTKYRSLPLGSQDQSELTLSLLTWPLGRHVKCFTLLTAK